MAKQVSQLFDAQVWHEVPGFEELTDITYHKHQTHGMVRVAFNRPEVRNSFTPRTVEEMRERVVVGAHVRRPPEARSDANVRNSAAGDR